jgi:hypothetical protein
MKPLFQTALPLVSADCSGRRAGQMGPVKNLKSFLEMKLYRRIVPDEGRSSHPRSYSRFHRFLLVHHDVLQVIRCSFCCSCTLSESWGDCCPPLEYGWSLLYGLHAFRLCRMLLRSQLPTSSSLFFVGLEYAKHDG